MGSSWLGGQLCQNVLLMAVSIYRELTQDSPSFVGSSASAAISPAPCSDPDHVLKVY